MQRVGLTDVFARSRTFCTMMTDVKSTQAILLGETLRIGCVHFFRSSPPPVGYGPVVLASFKVGIERRVTFYNIG